MSKNTQNKNIQFSYEKQGFSERADDDLWMNTFINVRLDLLEELSC